MISIEDYEKIARNAVAGRGLWLGLYLPESVTKSAHNLAGHLDPKAHVTLTHFGKKNSADTVQRIVSVLNDLISAEMIAPDGWLAEITGVGWFWRRDYPTLVALVNSRQICDDLRSPLVEALGDLCDKRYGFIPHITMNTNDVFELGRSCIDGPAIRVTFPTMHLVCGDAQVAVR